MFKQDPIARELALSRCEHVADREYLERVRREEHRREQVAREEQEDDARAARARKRAADLEQRRRVTRKSPRVPELGATPKESAAICSRQGGKQTIKPATDGPGVLLVCSLGGTALYVAFVPHEATDPISAVKIFFEDADVAVVRSDLETRFGPAARVEVHNGFRAWIWDRSVPQVDLRSYDRGVTITFRVAEDQADADAGDASTVEQ
jgi:hypothetical protein